MNIIRVSGIINFHPSNLTKKHVKQSEWKKTAVVEIADRDICAYYRWFIKKRHNLELTQPKRHAHITFVSDRTEEISNWDNVSKKYHNKPIIIELSLDSRTDGLRWWLNVNDRNQLHAIRSELGLGRPFFGLHMTIGNVREKQLEHGNYIKTLYDKGYIR